MIITCNNCNKNFEVDSSVIPENGRLLQCNSCNYKWFFKKNIKDQPVTIIKINESKDKQEPHNNDIQPFTEELAQEETREDKSIKTLNNVIKDNFVIKKISTNEITENKNDSSDFIIEKSKNKKNNNILSLTIVFIVSFIALIIFLDTFQKPISNMIPNIEFLLYNLYESINDIVLFFKDLV